MKLTLYITAMIYSIGLLNAQVAFNTESNDSTNIYFQAFNKYCIERNQITFLVEENDLTTKSLPSEINGQKIELINASKLQSLVKKGKQIDLIRIVPLRVKDGEFFVNIIVFKVEGKRRQLNLINQGGVSVVFNYNEALKTFVFKELR
ncbi:MAG: hypothetical protein K0B37_18240 [Bacteroidales bacterium]|nr:hypothetical protein [Bacteroidales bacterium]